MPSNAMIGSLSRHWYTFSQPCRRGSWRLRHRG